MHDDVANDAKVEAGVGDRRGINGGMGAVVAFTAFRLFRNGPEKELPALADLGIDRQQYCPCSRQICLSI